MHFGIEWAWAHGFERLGKIPSNVSIYELRCDFPFGYATFGDHKGFCNIAPEIAVTEKKKKEKQNLTKSAIKRQVQWENPTDRRNSHDAFRVWSF